MPDEVPVVAAPETPAEPVAEVTPPSRREVLEGRYDAFEKSQASAQEPAAVETPADGTPAKAATDQPAAEVKAAETTPAQPEKIVATSEQLADSAFWGGLTSDQWKAMERDYPVQTKDVKAAKAAATRIVNEARKQAPPAAPATERQATPTEDEPSAELVAAVEMSQDLDPKISAKGHLAIARLTAATVAKEIGVDPERGKADVLATSAYQTAVAEMPELKGYDLQELAKIVDESPALLALVKTGTVENIALAMVESGKVYKASKATAATTEATTKAAAAAEAKKKETQAVVKSNARPATSDLVKPSGAAPAKMDSRARKEAAYDREVARQNAGR